MRASGKSDQSGVQSVRNTAMCVQRVQPQIHAQWKDTRVSGGDQEASVADVLFGGKRKRGGEDTGDEQVERGELDKKKGKKRYG